MCAGHCAGCWGAYFCAQEARMLLDEDQNQTHRVKSKRVITSSAAGCCAGDKPGLKRVNDSLPDVAQLVRDSAGSQSQAGVTLVQAVLPLCGSRDGCLLPFEPRPRTGPRSRALAPCTPSSILSASRPPGSLSPLVFTCCPVRLVHLSSPAVTASHDLLRLPCPVRPSESLARFSVLTCLHGLMSVFCTLFPAETSSVLCVMVSPLLDPVPGPELGPLVFVVL